MSGRGGRGRWGNSCSYGRERAIYQGREGQGRQRREGKYLHFILPWAGHGGAGELADRGRRGNTGISSRLMEGAWWSWQGEGRCDRGVAITRRRKLADVPGSSRAGQGRVGRRHAGEGWGAGRQGGVSVFSTLILRGGGRKGARWRRVACWPRRLCVPLMHDGF